MIKKNLAWKLAFSCVAVAIALMGTFTFAIDENEITTGPQQQTQVQTSAVETEASDANDKAEYTVATYKASQSESMSFVSKKTDALSGNMYERKEVTSATTTKKSAETEQSQQTTAAATQTQPVQQTTTSTAAYKRAEIYYAYTAAATKQTTTAWTYAAPKAVTTTTRATTTTTKAAPVTTTTQKPVNITDESAFAAPVITGEKTYDTDYTHPYNHQTNQIRIHWNSVSGASKYTVYVKNGQYSSWTNVAVTASTDYTVTGLRRETVYDFAVRAVDNGGKASAMSAAVSIKTARMDYSAAGWQAMCRIVYHEVGGAASSFWDKPIVYVADCVTNQYVCAKYTKQGSWPKYYSKYQNIESIIYTSGGFLSDAGLTSRGATYSKVTERVKKAVWGATYGITYYNNIANDYNVFFWCNSPVAKTSSKIAYGFKIPWGYMYIWRQYWG